MWLLSISDAVHIYLLQGNLIGRAVIEYCDNGPPVSFVFFPCFLLFSGPWANLLICLYLS
jgi:hypothetical protein